MRQKSLNKSFVGLLMVPMLTLGIQAVLAGGPSSSGAGGGALVERVPDTLVDRVAPDGQGAVPEGGADLLEIWTQPGWPASASELFGIFSNEDTTQAADDFTLNEPTGIVQISFDTFVTGFVGDPDNPGSDFFIRIWADDGGMPTPVGTEIFESGPHNLGDGVLTASVAQTDQASGSAVQLKFNFGFEVFVTAPNTTYWIGVSGTGPGGSAFGPITSFQPPTGFGMVQAAGGGAWGTVVVGDNNIETDQGFRLWSFAPTGGISVVSMAGISGGGGCPGGCCIRITPTTDFISECNGGNCPTSAIFGPNCFADVVFPAGLGPEFLAQALKLAFDNQAGCDSSVITAENIGPRLIITTNQGTKPKLCLSINGNDVGILGGFQNCTAAGCGYNYQVGPTVTLPEISAGVDRFTTVNDDCALPLASDDGTWIDLDVPGSLFDRDGLPAADGVNQRLRLSGIARSFAIDDSDISVRRQDPAVFGECSGDFSRPGDQGSSFSPDGVVDDEDVAAFDANCAGQSEPFAGDCDFFDYNGDDVIDADDRDVLLCLKFAGNTSECCPNRVDPGTGLPDLPQQASNIVNTDLARLHLRGCENLAITRAGGGSENWIVDAYVSASDPTVGAFDIPPCEPGDSEVFPANTNDIIENADDLMLLAEGAPRRLGGSIMSTDCDFAPFWPGDQDADIYRFSLAFPAAVEITATGVDANPECAGVDGAITSLWLYNDRAIRLANDDPAGANDPIIRTDLDAGVYFILVAAAGQVQEPLPEGFPPSFPDCSIAFAPEVDFGATDPTGFYDLSLTVIPGSTMRITQESATGGTYQARTLFQPVLTYQRVCDPAHTVLVDTGGTGLDAFVLDSTGPWTNALAEGTDLMPGDAGFVPGVDADGNTSMVVMTEANGLGFAQRVQAAARRDCASVFDDCAFAQGPDDTETLDFITANTNTLVNFPVADNFTVDQAVEIQSVTFWVEPAGVVTQDHVFNVRILGNTTGAGPCAIGIPDEGNVISDGASGSPFILPTALNDVDQVTLNLLNAFTAQPGVTYWVELSVNTAESSGGAVSFVTSLEGDNVFFQDIIPAAGQPGDPADDCGNLDGDGWDCTPTTDDAMTECDESDPDGDQRTDGNLAFCVGTTRADTLTKTLPSDITAGNWRESPGTIVWAQPFAVRADGTIGFFSDLGLGTNGGNQAADSFIFFEDTTITGINWRGTYTSNSPDPNADDFRIEFWSDAGGLPDAQLPNGVFTPENSEIVRTSANLTGDPGRQVFEYSYQLATPIVAASDQTLWLSVINDSSGQPYDWAFASSSGGNGDGKAALRAGLDDNPPWDTLPDPGDPPTDFSFDITVAGSNPIICGDSVDGVDTATGLGYRFDPLSCTINGFQQDDASASGTRWRNISAPWKMFEIVPANGATASDIGPLFADMGVTLSQTQIEALAANMPEGALIDRIFTGTAAFDTDPDINGISLGGTLSATCNGAVTESINPTIALSQQLTVNGIMMEGGAATATVESGQAPPPEILHQEGLPGQTRPHSGYIDPLKESNNGADIQFGLTSTRIRFSQPVFQCAGGGPLDTSNFVMSETGGGTPPTVTGVTQIEDSLFEVTWDRFITIRQWTTVQAVNVCNAGGDAVPNQGDLGAMDEPDRVDLGYLPMDVNQSGGVNPLDLLKFKQFVNGISTPDQGLLEDFVDTNRSGNINPLDLLRFKQGINGIVPPSTQGWAFVSMLSSRP